MVFFSNNTHLSYMFLNLLYILHCCLNQIIFEMIFEVLYDENIKLYKPHSFTQFPKKTSFVAEIYSCEITNWNQSFGPFVLSVFACKYFCSELLPMPFLKRMFRVHFQVISYKWQLQMWSLLFAVLKYVLCRGKCFKIEVHS